MTSSCSRCVSLTVIFAWVFCAHRITQIDLCVVPCPQFWGRSSQQRRRNNSFVDFVKLVTPSGDVPFLSFAQVGEDGNFFAFSLMGQDELQQEMALQTRARIPSAKVRFFSQHSSPREFLVPSSYGTRHVRGRIHFCRDKVVIQFHFCGITTEFVPSEVNFPLCHSAFLDNCVITFQMLICAKNSRQHALTCICWVV